MAEQTMLKIVARAIAEAQWDRDQKHAKQLGDDSMLTPDGYMATALVLARAALTEMREPTEAMKNAGEVALNDDDEIARNSWWKQTAVWQAMIDAAVKG